MCMHTDSGLGGEYGCLPGKPYVAGAWAVLVLVRGSLYHSLTKNQQDKSLMFGIIHVRTSIQHLSELLL